MIKGVVAVTVFIAILLAFSHPTPFRIPDYLLRRTRIIDSVQQNSREVYANFNGDTASDRAYIQQLTGPLGQTVEIRFNHLIPSIMLSDKYDRVTHIEYVQDMDGDGKDELYFIAADRNSCSGMGILTHLVDGRWIELQTIRQYACTQLYEYERLVTPAVSGQYYIAYRTSMDSEEQSFRGKFK